MTAPVSHPALDPMMRTPLPAAPSMAYLKPLVADHPKIEAGDFTYIHSFEDPERFADHVKYAFDFIEDKLVIGKFCSIAHGASFVLNGGNHFADRLSSYPFSIFGAWGEPDPGPWPNKGGITIGHDVWIGWDAVIMPGVTVGPGAIIAAKSVVTADVEPYTIVGGNPARPIRKRLPEADIERLLELKWWDWPVETIQAASDALMKADVDALERFTIT
ncbi:CatB-related O-acetyltransferase [Maricaulis parjimensis]|uniref:CatB-related O-acetyltransferase n=1 Tax=Maricaulis parjimensis TaxID=144023 RepID=UPI001EED16A4|nr:CatB-related O-acetyltransferase [Maricaulis parjimensis]